MLVTPQKVRISLHDSRRQSGAARSGLPVNSLLHSPFAAWIASLRAHRNSWRNTWHSRHSSDEGL